MKLDDARRSILSCESSWAVVQAFAGAGKTRLAIEMASRFLKSPGLLEGQKILFVSFSNASCFRAREALQKSSIHRRSVEVTTFHSLGFGLVRRYASRLGLKGPVHTGRPSEAGGTHVSFSEIVALATKLLESPDVASLFSETFPLVIVDEFQDTSEELFSFLSRAFPPGSTRVRGFGDPYQRIQPGGEDYDAHAVAVGDGASSYSISPLRGFCRYVSGEVPRTAKALRDGNGLTNTMDNVEYCEVGSEDEQLAHAIYWKALEAQAQGRKAAVLAFSNESVAKLHDLLTTKTDKRTIRLRTGVIAAQHLEAARDWLFVVLLDHWLRGEETSMLAVAEAAALLSVAGSDQHRYFKGRAQKLGEQCRQGTFPSLPYCGSSRTPSRTTEAVLEELGIAAAAVGGHVSRAWPSAGLSVSGLEGLANRLCEEVPAGFDILVPDAASRLARVWDQTRRWRRARDLPVSVMTVNQSKNREFDDVFVYIDGYKNQIRGPISELNRMQMYVAVSRAKRYVRIVSHEGKKIRRSRLLQTVFGSSP